MLSPLGNRSAVKKTVSAAPRSSRSPSAPSSTIDNPGRDLVELTGGTTAAAAKGALKNAGSFFLRHGLALAGAAVAGPVGLVVGGLASGAVSAISHSEEGPASMLKSGVKSTVTSLGLGLAAGLPGLLLPSLGAVVPGALATLGTSLAGALDFQSRRGNADFDLHLDKLASRYHDAVAGALTESGRSTELLGPKPEPRFFPLVSPQAKKAQISLAKTALVASKLLGPAAAVALAGQIGREGVDASLLTSIANPQSSLQPVSKQTVEGIEVERVEGLAQSHRTDGFALYNKVYLDSNLPLEGEAKADFVLGHEMSHVRHGDSSATLIQKAVIESVAAARRLTGDRQESSALAALESELESARLAESRTLELRADREGLEYALRQGHSKDAVLGAASELFSNEPEGDDTYREHPEALLRLRAMEKFGLTE